MMDRPARLLVFRLGQLGDTLVAVPALRVLRRHFAGARVTLLCERQPRRGLVMPWEVIRETGLVDAFLQYPAHTKDAALGWGMRMAALLLRLRAGRFTHLAYLAPSVRPARAVRRDLRFFRWAGIDRVVGAEGLPQTPDPQIGSPLPEVRREADLLLARLEQSGLAVPEPRSELHRLEPTRDALEGLGQWLASLPPDGGRAWIGVGPGSKMPCKMWPAERYAEVVRRLIAWRDVWPVVFGSPAEQALGQRLVAQWGRGYVAAGPLSVSQSLAALSRCAMYLGNDSGSLHLAAAAGSRCVGIYTARDLPGKWDPCGAGHIVLRRTVHCAGCMLESCDERQMQCLLSITVEEVENACRRLLS